MSGDSDAADDYFTVSKKQYQRIEKLMRTLAYWIIGYIYLLVLLFLPLLTSHLCQLGDGLSAHNSMLILLFTRYSLGMV